MVISAVEDIPKEAAFGDESSPVVESLTTSSPVAQRQMSRLQAVMAKVSLLMMFICQKKRVIAKIQRLSFGRHTIGDFCQPPERLAILVTY